MNAFTSQVLRGLVTEAFANEVETHWLRKSRILILVDGRLEVVTDPAPEIAMEIVESSEAFGIAVAIGQLKDFATGFSSFEVTVATRDGDGSPKPGHDITGFRFSDAVLERFDQVWMFGIWPDTDDSTDPAMDAVIDDPMFNPPSDAELAALARWMDAGGGLFATGDHHLLGATMCHRVPRAGLMRAWTIADGVPTKFSPTRQETTRPFSVEQMLGIEEIDYDEEQDRLPQLIDWVPFQTDFILPISRPHPLLCHPELGPINILPDHMHEGRCHDFSDSTWTGSRRDLGFDFDGYANDHFPAVAGIRPLPKVVAWGTTLADPPLMFKAGDQPYRRFPLIGAYDGQEIGIGRVVTDSTWHHWFDMNVKGMMDHARASGDRTAIDKIFRYWVNVGIYLASPEWRAGMLLGELKTGQLGYFGRQAISLGDPARELGHAALSHLQAQIGACWVSEIANEYLQANRTIVDSEELADRPRFAVGFDDIEESVIGEVVRAAYADGDELRRQIARTGSVQSSPLFKTLYSDVMEAAQRGYRAALDIRRRELTEASEDLETLERVEDRDNAARQ